MSLAENIKSFIEREKKIALIERELNQVKMEHRALCLQDFGIADGCTVDVAALLTFAEKVVLGVESKDLPG